MNIQYLDIKKLSSPRVIIGTKVYPYIKHLFTTEAFLWYIKACYKWFQKLSISFKYMCKHIQIFPCFFLILIIDKCIKFSILAI